MRSNSLFVLSFPIQTILSVLDLHQISLRSRTITAGQELRISSLTMPQRQNLLRRLADFILFGDYFYLNYF